MARIKAGHTVDASSAERGVCIASGVVRSVATLAAPVDALPCVHVGAVHVIGARPTLGPFGTLHAMGCIATTASVIGWIALDTALRHTLRVWAIPISEATDALLTVHCTQRGVPTATRVVFRVTELTLLADALAPLAVPIVYARDAAAPVGSTHRLSGIAPIVISRVARGTCLALVTVYAYRSVASTPTIVCGITRDTPV